MRITKLLALAFVFASSLPTAAQSNSSYDWRIFQQGTETQVASGSIPAAQINCGLIPATPTPGTIANPAGFAFTDPTNALLECAYNDAQNGNQVFGGLPFAATAYDLRVRAVNTAGQGPEATASNPFTRPGFAPAILTNVRVTPRP